MGPTTALRDYPTTTGSHSPNRDDYNMTVITIAQTASSNRLFTLWHLFLLVVRLKCDRWVREVRRRVSRTYASVKVRASVRVRECAPPENGATLNVEFSSDDERRQRSANRDAKRQSGREGQVGGRVGRRGNYGGDETIESAEFFYVL